jgi:hypothetical protein
MTGMFLYVPKKQTPDTTRFATATERMARVIVEQQVLHSITLGICKGHLLLNQLVLPLHPDLHSTFLPIEL